MSQADVEARMIEIWRRLLGSSGVTVQSDWFGFHPGFKAPLLFAEIRREFGVDLPDPVLYRDRRLRDLANTVAAGRALPAIERVVPLRAGHRPPALVYVPGAFGEDLHALQSLVRLDHPVYFLRAPGLDPGERPLRDVRELAAFHLDHLLPVLHGEPSVLAGFSMGGMVALEMERLGARRGWRPLSVVLIDMLPPLAGDGADELDEEDLVTFRLQRVLDRLAGPEPAPVCFGTELTPEKIAVITDYLHRRDAPELPAGVPWDFLERRLHVYAAGTRAGNAHTIRPCDSPVGYIRTIDGREQGTTWAETRRCGPVEILDVDCTHSTLWEDRAATEALEHFLSRYRA